MSPKYIYSMPTKVPCHPLNFRTAFAILINVVSRHSKLDMRIDWDRSQYHLVENCGVSFRILKTVQDREKKWITKLQKVIDLIEKYTSFLWTFLWIGEQKEKILSFGINTTPQCSTVASFVISNPKDSGSDPEN